MLDIVGNYGATHEIKFNPNKCTVMVVKTTKQYIKKKNPSANVNLEIKLKLDNKILPVVECTKYLGIYINAHLSETNNMDEKIKGLITKVHQLNKLGFNSPNISLETKAFYFRTYIRPYLTHGLDAISLSNKANK